ncbi:MAG: phospho-N-acetylmuramoyl-pentapeptide-transferase [Clostridia bacterium]|nr:phospho-N-acetylmuramoyl-pentapeptide-transferase [Clostridia bacterium]
MITIILAGVTAIIFSIIAGILAIPLLKKLKAGQTVLSYVKEHKDKNGTPTMGGLFFVFSAVLAFFVFGGGSVLSKFVMYITVAFLAVGFIDDFIKIKSRKNEGLKPYQKIIFQLLIAVISGFYAYYNKLTVFFIPFSRISVDLGFFSIPLITTVFLAVTNSVNLTDGLDGLAGSVTTVFLLGLSVLIAVQAVFFGENYLLKGEYLSLIKLSVTFIGAILGFLCFNTNKASVFMGDTGSLALGGLTAGIAIFSGNTFFIPIIGITYALSSISVIIQVIYFKRTKKRVFLMAPLHHHFQHKGYSESKIAFIYSLITIVASCFSVISFL